MGADPDRRETTEGLKITPIVSTSSLKKLCSISAGGMSLPSVCFLPMFRPHSLSLALAALLLTALPVSAQVIITLQNATATHSQGGYPISAAIDGSFQPNTGWAHSGLTQNDAAVFETVVAASFSSYDFTLFNVDTVNPEHIIGRFRISATTDDRSTFADGLQNGGAVTANWIVLNLTNLVSSAGSTLTVLDGASVLAGGPVPQTDIYTFTATTSLAGITGFRLEVFTDASLGNGGPGRASNGNFVLTEFSVVGIPEPSTYVLLACGLVVISLAVRRRRS